MHALRAIPAGILAGASAVLAGAAKLAEVGARRLAPPTPPAPGPVEEAGTADEAGTAEGQRDAGTSDTLRTMTDRGPDVPDDTGRVVDLPPTDDRVLDDSGEARTYESRIAEIAEHNVATVVREIQDLSTEELGQLFEYESAHRKRKTVLQAIERAAAPAGEEQVYTTETPS